MPALAFKTASALPDPARRFEFNKPRVLAAGHDYAGSVGFGIVENVASCCLKARFALVFFGFMLLPVSGLIRHGIISGGADRYAYLSTIIAVPYGGYAVARWLLRGSDSASENQRLAAPACDAPERKVSSRSRHTSKQRKNADVTNARPIHNGRMYWWAIWLLLTGALLSISTNLLSDWRNEDSLYAYSLRYVLNLISTRHYVRLFVSYNFNFCLQDGPSRLENLRPACRVSTPCQAMRSKQHRMPTSVDSRI